VSLTAHDPRRTGRRRDRHAPPAPVADEDLVPVTCTACGHLQHANGRAAGYTCETCGSVWRVLRCRGCRHASVVLDGVTECPRCGRSHRSPTPASAALPAWLDQPAPLSVWLGGARYLGGHADRDQPITAAGLLLDRRGIHVRAFADIFTIPWATVRTVDIEGPLDISERITMPRLVALGATTWATTLSYLTVHTWRGDAIFEIEGLAPPELRARLSRVLQGLEQSAPPPAPIALERGEPTPMAIDPATTDAPLEVLLVDALWKLAQLRDAGLLGADDIAVLRARLLAQLPDRRLPGDDGPFLRV
jgi:predicted RNA-binding Zn-ribbon protein involved in translation (DUF1610 family)